MSLQRTSINRNIVECKDRLTALQISDCFRINRNIVECKDSYVLRLSYVEWVLIETLWNVKIDSRIGANALVSINRNIVECKVVIISFLCIYIKY